MFKKSIFSIFFIMLLAPVFLQAQDSNIILSSQAGLNQATPTMADETNAKEYYTGTLVIENNKFVFLHCTADLYGYYLLPEDGDEVKFDSIMSQYVSPTEAKPITLVLIGKFENIEGQRYILVEKVTDFKKDVSCHIFEKPKLPYKINLDEAPQNVVQPNEVQLDEVTLP